MNATVWPLRIVARRLLRPTRTRRVLGAALSGAGIALAYSLATGPAPVETMTEASTAATRAESSLRLRPSNAVLPGGSPAADGAGANAGPPIGRGMQVSGGAAQRTRDGVADAAGPDDEESALRTLADRDEAGSAATVGGRPLEPMPHAPGEVLNITNIGDRIVVSRHAPGAPVIAPVPPRSVSAETDADNSGNGDEQADTGAAQRPDYEDVYPGCPRVLPEGADAQMAQQRQRDYGCLYYESCAISEESPPPCRWHLIKKL